MNLIITINNAQMQALKRDPTYRCTNDNGKENSERSDFKGEKRIPCVVTAKIQLTSSVKSQILNKEISFQDSDHGRASKRAILDWF